MSEENLPLADDARTGPGRQGSPDGPVVRVNSPAGLLALVPSLLEAAPADCVVMIGAEPGRGRVRMTARFALPATPDAGVAGAIARLALTALASQGLRHGAVVGYGPEPLVTPVAAAIISHAAKADVYLADVLRAEDGRYWSYLCTEPTCCPPGGVPYDAAGNPVTGGFPAAGAPSATSYQAE